MLVASYHYKFRAGVLVLLCLTACAGQERTTPHVTAAVVPDLVGETVERAVRTVEAAGLRAQLLDPRASVVELPSCRDGVVVRQSDPAGDELVRGSFVDLTVTACSATASPRP